MENITSSSVVTKTLFPMRWKNFQPRKINKIALSEKLREKMKKFSTLRMKYAIVFSFSILFEEKLSEWNIFRKKEQNFSETLVSWIDLFDSFLQKNFHPELYNLISDHIWDLIFFDVNDSTITKMNSVEFFETLLEKKLSIKNDQYIKEEMFEDLFSSIIEIWNQSESISFFESINRLQYNMSEESISENFITKDIIHEKLENNIKNIIKLEENQRFLKSKYEIMKNILLTGDWNLLYDASSDTIDERSSYCLLFKLFLKITNFNREDFISEQITKKTFTFAENWLRKISEKRKNFDLDIIDIFENLIQEQNIQEYVSKMFKLDANVNFFDSFLEGYDKIENFKIYIPILKTVASLFLSLYLQELQFIDILIQSCDRSLFFEKLQQNLILETKTNDDKDLNSILQYLSNQKQNFNIINVELWKYLMDLRSNQSFKTTNKITSLKREKLSNNLEMKVYDLYLVSSKINLFSEIFALKLFDLDKDEIQYLKEIFSKI